MTLKTRKCTAHVRRLGCLQTPASEAGAGSQPSLSSIRAGPERMFVRVHDAVAHCAAVVVRNDDLGQPLQNGHSSANGAAIDWRTADDMDISVPLLVHETLDNT